MNKKNFRQPNGFTLAEALVYCGIFSMATVMIAQLIVSLLDEQRDFLAERSIEQQGQFLNSRIAYSVHNANFIEIPFPNEIRLKSRDYAIGADIYTFYRVNDGCLESAQSPATTPQDSDWQTLSNPEIVVKNIGFHRIDSALTTQFELQKLDKSSDFISTYVLRQPEN